jgi:hypothetical protein
MSIPLETLLGILRDNAWFVVLIAAAWIISAAVKFVFWRAVGRSVFRRSAPDSERGTRTRSHQPRG